MPVVLGIESGRSELSDAMVAASRLQMSKRILTSMQDAHNLYAIISDAIINYMTDMQVPTIGRFDMAAIAPDQRRFCQHRKRFD